MRSKTSWNDLCPCGSGKKYKKCHLENDQPEWGRVPSWLGFWQLALAQEPLGEVMAWLDQQGVVVP